MKVLLIDVNGNQSSTGQLVHDIYLYLRSNGEEAAICYGRGPEIHEYNVHKFGFNWETYIHAALTRITGFTGCFSFFSTKRLLKHIMEYNPDVVHIHELHAYFVNIKPLLSYLAKHNIKVVHTLHSEFSYTGKCGHSVECEKWKTECGNCPKLHSYVESFFFDHTRYMFNQKKHLFSMIDNLILTAPSKWLYDRIGESFLSKYPRYIVHNGVDTDTFKPVDTTELKNKFKIAPDEIVLLALAPNLMSKAKGGAFIRKMALDLCSENIRFILVGVDGETTRIDDNCVICGRIYDKKLLAQYYSLADAFIICSERENYPTTCLEAQACGTPVYGFNTGGTKETLLLHEDLLVKYGDLEQLENLIKNVRKKTEQDTHDLRQLAVQKLSRKQAVRDYCELYKE